MKALRPLLFVLLIFSLATLACSTVTNFTKATETTEPSKPSTEVPQRQSLKNHRKLKFFLKTTFRIPAADGINGQTIPPQPIT